MLIRKKKLEKLEERIDELECIVTKHEQHIHDEILNPECHLTQIGEEAFEKIVRDQLMPCIEDIVAKEQRKWLRI